MQEWTINFLNDRKPLVVEGETFATVVEAYLQKNKDLTYADLSDTDLSHADLSYANLSHADLSHADLRFVNLTNTDLRYANLNHANLHDANLTFATLSHTNLTYANLNYTTLSDTDLSYANLSYANLHDADVSHADLRFATLSNTDLRYANLINTDLDFSCLSLCCGSFKVKIDKRIACQLLYHALRAMQSVVDEEVRAVLNDDKVLALANQFHRVAECGEIKKEK